MTDLKKMRTKQQVTAQRNLGIGQRVTALRKGEKWTAEYRPKERGELVSR